MERPSKRPRLSDGPVQEEFDLGEARARNNLKLKSRFESIFEKYGQDFSSLGDEIDLKTGAIVVNNGHLEEMQDEQDIGRAANGEEPEEGASSNGDPEFDWIDHDEELEDGEPSLPPNYLNGEDYRGTDSHIQADYGHDIQHEGSTTSLNHQEPKGSESEAEKLLSSFLPGHRAPGNAVKSPHYNNENPNGSTPVARHGTQETPSTSKNPPKISPIEPLWQTPEIDGLLPSRVAKSVPMYTPDREIPVSPSGGKSLWAGPWTRLPRKDKGAKRGPGRPRSTMPKRKLFSKADLQALRNFNFSETAVESDDSDDPLQDDSYSTPVKRPSPSPGALRGSQNPETPSGPKNDGKQSNEAYREHPPEREPDDHHDNILHDEGDDVIHDLKETRETEEALTGPLQPDTGREREDGESKLISNDITAPPSVPVSNTPISQKRTSKKRIRSPSKASPSQQNVNGTHNAQYSPDKDKPNDFDPLDDEFDRVSTTSGLSSIQIEPSPIKTPRGKRGFSSPLAARSSAMQGDDEGRFSLFSKRPIKVPIFRRP